MKIQVKIMPKEEYNEYNLGWSKPVDIDEFILNQSDIEFEWEDDSRLPYDDFIFFGNEYYYRILINDKLCSEFDKYLEELEEKACKYNKLNK